MVAKKTSKKAVSKKPIPIEAKDGWPTREQFARGWWTVPAGTPTYWETVFEHDRRRRDLADMGCGPFF